MKKFATILLMISYLCLTNCGNNSNTKDKEDLEGNISVSGAFALYPLATKWADEFMALHPKVRIDISAGGAGKGMTDALKGMVDLGMVSREVSPEEISQGAWYISVTKDAVVPIISNDNPNIQQLVMYGLTKEKFENIFIKESVKTWGELLGNKSKEPIKAFTRSDACGAAEVWAKYLGKKQEDLKGVGIFGDPGLVEAVKKEKFGIGYGNIAFVYDCKTKFKNNGIYVVPIDVNANGIIDDDEHIYDNLDILTKAIADGKYPSPPARDLHFVSKGKPNNKIVIEFLRWILTDGQKFVNESGYVELSKEKIEKGLKSLE